ncbi:MAG: ABC transporter permease [Planctomycetota bacterium]|jgi:hypothetical protein
MRSIWAVARNTLAQAVRMKIAAVVVLLLLILLPLMSMVMDGDGTLLGKLRTFTSYGLGLIGMLLCILTIAVSTFTLSNDIKRKHIFLVITKPIRRWELVVGKLLAIVFLNIVLLGVFSGIVYGCTLLIPRISDASEMEKMRADAEFFTARVGVESFLDKEQLKEKAQKHYKELKDSGQIPEEMSYQRAIRELLGQEVMKAQKVDPGEVKEWDFENVRVKNPDDPNALIFVRCQFRVTVPPPDETVFGMWRIGDLRQLKIGGKVVTPIYNVERRAAVRTAQEFVIPADAIAEDGYLGLAFYNNPALNKTTIIPEDLKVLYRTGSFTENFFRAVLMVLVRLVFLAVLGISLTTWLSFPVAILVCVLVFFVGLTNGFILDAIDSLGATAGIIYSLTVKPLLWLLPQFDGDYNPNSYIVDGRTIRWGFLLMNAVTALLAKGLLVLIAGCLIFSRREVAKAVT